MVMMSSHAFAGENTYAVGVQIKNLDNDNAADVEVNYYNESDGSLESTLPVTIPAGDSFTMATLDGVDEGFDGSAVVSSDREIAAIANVFANGFSGMGASYTAFSGGAESANLPLVMRGNYGFNTWFKVQNTGSAATTVTVAYDNGVSEDPVTIQPGAAKTFDQATNSNLADGFVGSATASASDNGSIVATVLQQGPTTLLGYDSFSDANASTNPVMPLVNTNNYGFITGIQIQNTGTEATDVTVSYTASLAGDDCTETKSVAAGSSTTFALGAFDGSETGETCADGETFVGSASVTANSTSQPLVAIVNQLNSGSQKGAAYGGFNPSSGTSTVVLPLIMDRNYGYFTGFSIVNVGSSATEITCSYTGSSVTNSETVQPNEALTVVNGDGIADGYVGAATCTTSGSIVGIVNELNSSASSDSFLVYEGTNQ
jgi:hypothetical protein